MPARKSGGTGARLKAKNAAMAAAMKAEGVTRSTAKCPICHKLVALGSLHFHIAACKG